MSGDTTGGTGTDTTKDSGTDTKVDDKAKGGDGTGGKPADTDTTDNKAKSDEDVTGLKKALQATRKERDDLLKAQREAELAKLPELDKAKAMVDELTKENEKLSLENRRYKVGMKLGLPWSLAKRLSGETDEEMEADGAELVKSYNVDGDKKVIKDDKANKRPPNDAKKDGGTGKPGMNEILRALRKG